MTEGAVVQEADPTGVLLMKLEGKKATIVGMGRTALAAARLMLREGARPFVTDVADAAALAAFCAKLDALGVPYECGGHTRAAFDDASLVVLSPGVPASLAVLERVRAAGVPVLGEMAFAYGYCRSRILAVTGTNGKTTTTELLRSLVEACGHSVALAGNNEVPLSAAVMATPAPEYVVIEVSSYQLETTPGCGGGLAPPGQFRPWIGAVLNVTPDHLGRHGSMAGYIETKARIFGAQGDGDIAVLNADDCYTAEMPVPEGAEVWRFSLEQGGRRHVWLDGEVIRSGSTPVADRSDIHLPGRHNVQNVLAALAMMRAGGFDWEKVVAGLRAFRALEHRIEHTASLDGVDFYNDSKATNIESLRAALDSFERPVVLIAGGQGKGSGYGVLRDLVGQRVKYLVTLGQDAALLEEALGDVVPTRRAADMAEAVALAAAATVSGDVVLLSPGCASFDMYDDFEHRGRDFKSHVRRYVAKRQEREGTATGDASPEMGAATGDASPEMGAATGDASPEMGAATGDASPLGGTATGDASPLGGTATGDASPKKEPGQ